MRTPSLDRIATWGWLMIGPVTTVPYEPTLVIVNVPPVRSSAVSRLALALAARSATASLIAAQALAAGVLDDRHDQGLEVDVDGDAEVDAAVDDQLRRRRPRR